MRYVSFDVDGTLIDNQQLVRQAYRMAGIDLTDDEWRGYFGKTFSEWLVEHCGGDYQKAWDIHREKNVRYGELITALESSSELVLAPTLLAREMLTRQGEIYIVTGASNVAAVTVLDFLGLGIDVLQPTYVSAALSIEGKIGWVQELETIHIDDDERIIEGLREVGYPYVIHYQVGDNLADLRAAVEYMWTQ